MKGARARRTVAVSCLLAAAALGAWPVPGQADEPEAVGWWQRDVPFQEGGAAAAQAPGGGAGGASVLGRQLPPPPTVPPPPATPPTLPPAPGEVPTPPVNPPPPAPVPEGGVYVANDAAGAVAVSALRFDGDGVGAARLVLDFADGSTVIGPVLACPALSDWTPVTNGEWRNRPAHDCSRLAVSGSVSDDGTQMSWSLPATFKPGDADAFDVILLPPPTDGSVFQLVFEKPGVDAFEVLSGPPPTTTTSALPPVPESELPPPAPALPAGAGGSTSYGATGGGSEQQTITLAGGTGGLDLPGPLGPIGDVLENLFARRVAAAVLVALGGLMAYSSRQPQRAPRLLGALAGNAVTRSLVVAPTSDRPRGVGRFARPRTGAPRGMR